jgi:MoaA/NifB/PqqE/SkfB family radical SAM enzyme
MTEPTPVTLSPRRRSADRVVAPPVSSRGWRRGTRVRTAETLTRLAFKEHVAPRLRVPPLVAELFLTENCNLRCTSCACWRTSTRGELTTDEWKRVIDQLHEVGVRKVNFTGGEPLLRADSIGLIEYAYSRGFRSLHLNTNAILLDARRRQAVLNAGVRSFNISVDGPDAATHDAIRGVEGAFDTTLEHLMALVARRDELRLRVRLNATVLRDNADALPGLAEMAVRLKVPLYLNLGSDTTFLFRGSAISPVVEPSRAVLRDALNEVAKQAKHNPRWLPRPSELRYATAHFDDLLQRSVPCAESQVKLLIHSDGRVGGCWGHDPHDNVRERSLASVVNDAQYRADHDRFFRKDCVGCGSGYVLNLRRRPLTQLADLRSRVADRR